MDSLSGSYLKASIDGPNGSGKSGTAARLALGISKEMCDSAPVLVFDSEERWRFYDRTIFQVEKVPLVRISGTSLLGLQKAFDRAEKEGACVFVGDQLTTPWMEGVREFSEGDGYLSFERRQQLMNQWEPVIRKFRYSKFHAICAGRVGYWWENLEDEETGRRRLTQGNAKFNAGGSANFGYEADLELEMRQNERRIRRFLRPKSSMEYVCDVRKDATGGLLNGKQFVFEGREGLYQAGDYKAVFAAFRPYLEFMAEVSPPTPDRASTRELLVSGKTAWKKDQDEKTALLEEIAAYFEMSFGSGQSTQGRMFKNLTINRWHGHMSWSRLETEASVGQLQMDLDILKRIYARILDGEMPADKRALDELITLAIDDHLHPTREHTTALAELAKKSVEAIKAKKLQVMAGD